MKRFFPVIAAVLFLTSLSPLFTQEDRPPAKVRTIEAENTEAYTSVMYGARVEPADRFVIRSPLTGTIVSFAVKEGARVTEGDIVFSVRRELSGRTYQTVEVRTDRAARVSKLDLREGDPVNEKEAVLTLIDDSSYNLTILVGDRDAPDIKTGDICSLYYDGALLPVRGRVTARAVEPDYSSGLFEMELTIPRHSSVSIGLFLRVEIRKNYFSGIVVETEHIERRYGGLYLPVITAGDTVTFREITPGAVYGDRTALAGGIEPGDRYIIWSERRLQDGDRIIEIP